MLKIYQFKHSVKDDRILRQKLQISNLLILEIVCMSHGTALSLTPIIWEIIAVRTPSCAFVIVSVSAIDFIKHSLFSKILISFSLPKWLQCGCNDDVRCIASCTHDNNFSTNRRQWKRCSGWHAKLFRVLTNLIFAVFDVRFDRP
jgi:hypothetical protein